MAKPDFQLKWGVNRVGGIPTTDPADYQLGWQYRGGLPPLTGNFDYYQNLADERLLYLNQLGVSEWDGAQEYNIGSIANRSGALYSCKTAAHVSATPPESDAVNWKEISKVISDYEVILASGSYVSGSYVIPSGRQWTDFDVIIVTGLDVAGQTHRTANSSHVTKEDIAINPTGFIVVSVTGNAQSATVTATSSTGFSISTVGDDAIKHIVGYKKTGVA